MQISTDLYVQVIYKERKAFFTTVSKPAANKRKSDSEKHYACSKCAVGFVQRVWLERVAIGALEPNIKLRTQLSRQQLPNNKQKQYTQLQY